MELEFVSTEKAVGPFSADILCKNGFNEEWVLIENQLEKTDHSHLGQIITFAAGLQATSVIWIARDFTEEHRAALDWLNEHTSERLRFFGVTIELWRIGNSVPAPRFNIVSRPNDWSKSVGVSKEVTASQSFRQRYWTAFKEKVEALPGPLRPPSPSTGNWVNFAVGKSNFQLAAVINPSSRWIRAELYLSGLSAKSRFQQLLQHKETIEQTWGPLDWQGLIGKQDCRIAIKKPDTDPTEESDWPNQHEWLREKIKALHAAFSPLVKQLKDEGGTFSLSSAESTATSGDEQEFAG